MKEWVNKLKKLLLLIFTLELGVTAGYFFKEPLLIFIGLPVIFIIGYVISLYA